jgi:serine/threonine protein kinase
MLEVIISKHYQIVEKLGIGPFYEVFKAKHTKN